MSYKDDIDWIVEQANARWRAMATLPDYSEKAPVVSKGADSSVSEQEKSPTNR